MSTVTTEKKEEELQAYHLAYNHLFRTILAKKGLPVERQKQVLVKIKAFQENKIKDIDSYLDHIPSFAKALGIKPDQLGAFIGSNLLKALQQVQAQQAQKKKVAAQALKVVNDPEVKRSILKEIILTIGSVIEPPNKFSPIDMGLMSLNIDGSVIEPTSKQGDSQTLGTPTTSTDQKGDSGQAIGSTKEGSLLEEIILVLGSDHAITEKLIVPAFPADMAAPDLSTPTANAPSDSTQSTTSEISILQEIVQSFESDLGTTEKLVVPAFPAGETPELQLDSKATAPQVTSSGIEGGSILSEIIDLLGDSSGVNEKLVLKSSIPGAENALGIESTAAQTNAENDAPDWEPIEFSFGAFDLAIRKVQNFQAKKDGAGYQSWLQNDGNQKARLMMSLRKVDAGIAQGKSINIEDELYNLSKSQDFHIEQIKEFHLRLKTFQKLQKLITVFIGKVKAQPKTILGGFQKIWPQVKLILNDKDTAEARMHKLKIPMLQIPDPKLKQAIMNMMKKLFDKFSEIENS